MRRLPIRLKLTLAFAVAVAVVLGVTGLVVYVVFRADFDRSIDQGLRARAADVTALVEQADQGLRQAGHNPLGRATEGFAQILDARGGVVDATPPLGGHPVLARGALAGAFTHTRIVDRARVPGVDGPARLLVTPVHAQDQPLLVVVGTSLEVRDDSLSDLRTLLLIGIPVALVLVAAGGYAVTAGALRPVESMRRRAAAVSTAGPGRRLPVPPSRDEIARLGTTLNEMLARLEAAFARERAFVSDASHELRTPLAILKTELELALRAGRSPAELRDAIASAAEETDRVAALAEDLLVIARSDQGRLPVRPADIDARELLETVRARFARRAGAGGDTLGVDAPSGVRIVADPLRLEQAVGNIVDNALRHGADEVTLRAVQRAAGVELHVVDNGPGFPAGLINRAFERFTRADSARGRDGSGLGLAIVAAIARAHGGSVGAANRREGGADVWIALPAQRAVDAGDPGSAPSASDLSPR